MKQGDTTSHTNPNTGEYCDCDRDELSGIDLMHVLDAENFYLWDDLSDAMRDAINGRWSMRCDWIVERIAMLEKEGALRPKRDTTQFTEEDRWMLAAGAADREFLRGASNETG